MVRRPSFVRVAVTMLIRYLAAYDAGVLHSINGGVSATCGEQAVGVIVPGRSQARRDIRVDSLKGWAGRPGLEPG